MAVRMRTLGLVGGLALSFVLSLPAASPVSKPSPRPVVEAGARVDLHGDPLPAGARARLGTMRLRHGTPIVRLAVSKDGKRLATLGTDRYLRLWDVQSKREIRSIAFPQAEAANSLAFSPNGRLLLAAVGDSAIHLWDAASGDAIKTFESMPGMVATAAWSPDSTQIVTTEPSETVHVWDVKTGNAVQHLKWQPPVRSLMELLELLWWKLAEGEEGNNAPTTYVAAAAVFSPDGKYLAACGPLNENGQAKVDHYRIWEVATWKPVREWTMPMTGASRLLYSPDGKVLAMADGQDGLHLFDPAAGKLLRTETEGGMRAATFSPDGRTLAVCHEPGVVRLIEPISGKEQKVITIPALQQTVLAFMPDGRRLAVAGSLTHVQFFDVATGKPLDADLGHIGPVLNVFPSRDGKEMITLGVDGTLRVWDAASGRQKRQTTLLPPDGSRTVMALAVAPDSQRFAFISEKPEKDTPAEGFMHLWDMSTMKEISESKIGADVPGCLAFSPDSRRLAAPLSMGAILWDARSGKQLRHIAEPAPKPPEEGAEEPPSGFATSAAFTPDGRQLVTVRPLLDTESSAGEAEVRRCFTFWEIATGRKRRDFVVKSEFEPLADVLLPDPRGVASETAQAVNVRNLVQFLPGGKQLLFFGSNNIYLHEARSGNEVRRFGGPRVHGSSGCVSPDGKYLAAGTHDGQIYLWEVATGTLLGRTQGHRHTVTQVAFTADGRTLTSVSGDTTALIWDVDTLRSRHREAPPALPPAQLQTLFHDLGSGDADRADAAIGTLVGVPADSLPYLGKQLKAQTAAREAGDVDRLIRDLDGATFEAREKAMKDLERLERLAEEPLRKALASPQTSLEVRRRMERLLDRLDAPVTEPERLRDLRAIEVLEEIGTPEARAILDRLAKGNNAFVLTREAKAALARLKPR